MAVQLADLDDINASLQGEDVENFPEATDENTELLQISVARIIRGYLAGAVDRAVLMSWLTPDSTPEIIREVAGQLIASRLFYNQTAIQSVDIGERHWAQILYDRAMATLNSIVSGEITILDNTGVTVTDTAGMSDLDFWPIDDTDRAFTMGMNL